MRKKSAFFRSFLAFWALFAFCAGALPAQQTDPFYLKLLEKAQKSFLARNYRDAARDFEIASFGLVENRELRAKALVYLGLSHYYLKDTQSSEEYLRQAADLVGEKELENLQIAESAWPDLEKLLIFFSIRQAPIEDAPPAPLIADKPAKAKPDDPNKQAALAPKQPAKKESAEPAVKEPTQPPQVTLDNIKEGDLVPLEMVETPPAVLKRIAAFYPAAARGFQIEGTVVVNALISEKGDVKKTEIITGIKGAFGFNQAAQSAVRQWKFEPATIKGIKVKVWMPIAIDFRVK